LDRSKQRILDLQKPQTKKELQKILEFTNFLRNFIVDYSKKTHDINDLMVNTKYKVNWLKENKKIWEQFIESIQKFAITNKLNKNSQLVMACGASGKGIGGVLFQHHGTDEEIEKEIAENTIPQKGNLKIVSIFSKKLNPAEGRYSTIEWELLAVVSSLKHSRHMILSSRKPLIILTDHRNLTTWEKFKVVRHRHFGWLETMEEYNLRIRFIPGYSNTIADSLS
jgi:RNase H-like domain found in reverse transcriptase